MSGWFHGKLSELGYATYEEYLSSSRWQALRQQFKSRDARCFLCRSRRFQLHHRSYERLGRETLDDVVPLCGRCHQEVHRMLLHAPERDLLTAHEWVREHRERRRAKLSPQQGAADRARARKRGMAQLRRGR